MSDTGQSSDSTRDQLARERTLMAGIRTEFALMRTGFTIASFGTAVTQLLGRGQWSPWITDGLTIVFVLLGMIVIQSAISHYWASKARYGVVLQGGPISRAARTIVPWGLQLALVAVAVLVMIY